MYDYEFTSLTKYGSGFVAKIMNAVQYAYARATRSNLPVYQIAHSDKFETYVTTKKD